MAQTRNLLGNLYKELQKQAWKVTWTFTFTTGLSERKKKTVKLKQICEKNSVIFINFS